MLSYVTPQLPTEIQMIDKETEAQSDMGPTESHGP